MLSLTFEHALRPSDGCEVCSPLAAPVKHDSKEAAGLAFSLLARRQSGLDGGQLTCQQRICRQIMPFGLCPACLDAARCVARLPKADGSVSRPAV